MLESLRLFKSISAKLATLRTAVQQEVDAGYTDLNKACEDLVGGLFNIVYDLDLINLNDIKKNHPAVDLGDKTQKYAVQVSSTSTDVKVNDMLEKFVRHDLHNTYTILKFFVVTHKKGKTTITAPTLPHIAFNPATDIMDVDDLLRVIEKLSVAKLREVDNYLEEQLSYTVEKLLKAHAGASNGETAAPGIPAPQIDVDASLGTCGMTLYQHSCINILLQEGQWSAPKLQQALLQFFDNKAVRNIVLPVLNTALLREAKPRRILYHQPPHRTGVASNYLQEWLLELSPNRITFEYAQYSNQPLMSNLKAEVDLFVALLLCCQNMMTGKFSARLGLSLMSNAKVFFEPRNNILLRVSPMKTFCLNDNAWQYEINVSDTNNQTVLNICQEMLHAFTGEVHHLLNPDPFLQLDEDYATFNIQKLREHLPTR